jgi:hypothetical protein
MLSRRRFCSDVWLHVRKSFVRYLVACAGIALLAIGAQTPRGQADGQPTQLDRDAILHHLNAVITWYRDATTKIKSVGLPSDAIYQDNARDLAAEAVRLAFQSARAEANIIAANSKPPVPRPPRRPAHQRPSNKTSARRQPKSRRKLTMRKPN